MGVVERRGGCCLFCLFDMLRFWFSLVICLEGGKGGTGGLTCIIAAGHCHCLDDGVGGGGRKGKGKGSLCKKVIVAGHVSFCS